MTLSPQDECNAKYIFDVLHTEVFSVLDNGSVSACDCVYDSIRDVSSPLKMKNLSAPSDSELSASWVLNQMVKSVAIRRISLQSSSLSPLLSSVVLNECCHSAVFS